MWNSLPKRLCVLSHVIATFGRLLVLFSVNNTSIHNGGALEKSSGRHMIKLRDLGNDNFNSIREFE